MLIHLDLESLSWGDLVKGGPHNYAQHPSTRILCISFIDSDSTEDPYIWYPYHGELNTELYGGISAKQTLHYYAQNPEVKFAAFNASFECSMWSEQAVKKLLMPPIPIERWQCTAAQARAVAIPGKLDQVARVLKLEEQKDKEGTALMRRMCILKPGANPEIKISELIRLGEYCKQDVRTEKNVHHHLPAMSDREQEIYILDQKINKRGVKLNVPLVENAVTIIKDSLERANLELKTLTGGKIKTIGQVKAITQFANDNGVPMEKLRAKDIDEKLQDPSLDETVRRVFELRRSAGRAAIKKYPAMLKAVCEDDKVRDHLMYCGAARTRRWSGQRLQTQNIARGFKEFSDILCAYAALASGRVDFCRLVFGDELAMLTNLVRSMLIASEGCRLIQADFSGIEARVLAVLTQNQMLLNDFVAGRDPYKSMAALIYDVSYEDVTNEQRFFGKQAILGLGYGMGANKFRETCANYGQDITLKFAKHVVDVYRKKNPGVPRFWRQIETDALKVIANHKAIQRRYYGFRWDEHMKALVMILPNGSERWYIDAAIELRDKWGEQKPTITYYEMDSARRWVQAETYGGKLTENLDQSIARELQSDALLAVDAAGYDIILHAHDEIVTDVHAHFGGSVLELVELMTSASKAWAGEWPIDAEGWEGPCYKK